MIDETKMPVAGFYTYTIGKPLSAVKALLEAIENAAAPLASDRCAVFMERDIIQLLNTGYSVNEILSTALHSVTENICKRLPQRHQ